VTLKERAEKILTIIAEFAANEFGQAGLATDLKGTTPAIAAEIHAAEAAAIDGAIKSYMALGFKEGMEAAAQTRERDIRAAVEEAAEENQRLRSALNDQVKTIEVTTLKQAKAEAYEDAARIVDTAIVAPGCEVMANPSYLAELIRARAKELVCPTGCGDECPCCAAELSGNAGEPKDDRESRQCDQYHCGHESCNKAREVGK